jgi:Ion channel
VLSRIFIGCLLVAGTVSVHALGLSLLLRALLNTHALPPTRFWPIVWLLVRVAWFLIFVHLLEISLWAFFYLASGCLSNAEAAFYFSGVTYATVGYGDLVLPLPWRLIAPVEGLTGILMCGLSTGVFFVIVNKLFTERYDLKTS